MNAESRVRRSVGVKQRRLLLRTGLSWLLPIAAVFFVVGPSCSCPRGAPPFVQTCDGSILEACNPKTADCQLRDCSAENATCAYVDDAGQAQCVPNPPPACDQTFVPYCNGDFFVYCDFSSGTGYQQYVDCFDLYATDYSPGWCFDPGGGQATCEWGN